MDPHKINIRRDATDPYYRYKMEPLQVESNHSNNGGAQTTILNLHSVAQSLNRPPAYIMKYLGDELGCRASTTPMDDQWIIDGAHSASILQDTLDGFITNFVLCKVCRGPETKILVKGKTIILDCRHCGHHPELSPDLKLSAFILGDAAQTVSPNDVNNGASTVDTSESATQDRAHNEPTAQSQSQ